VEEVDYMLGRNFLVSVSGHGGGGRGPFEKVEELAALDIANVEKGPDYLLHVILDFIVDKKFTAIEAVQDEIDAAEETILQDTTGFKAGTLMHLRRELLALRKSLFHEREILIKICRRDCPFVGEKSIYSYRDIYDHLAKFFEFIEITRETVSALMELFLSQQNNRLTLASNQNLPGGNLFLNNEGLL
jgi:magnesium transporter